MVQGREGAQKRGVCGAPEYPTQSSLPPEVSGRTSGGGPRIFPSRGRIVRKINSGCYTIDLDDF